MISQFLIVKFVIGAHVAVIAFIDSHNYSTICSN